MGAHISLHSLVRDRFKPIGLLVVFNSKSLPNIMAEVIGFGASVLTFITIATQLAKAAFATYETVTDAHEEIKRVRTRLNDLRFILLQIYHRRIHSSSTGEPDPAYWDDKSARYWDEKSAQLWDSFAQLEKITSRLNETQPVARLRWLLSGQDRARKLLALLTEDLAVLKTLNQFMLES